MYFSYINILSFRMYISEFVSVWFVYVGIYSKCTYIQTYIHSLSVYNNDIESHDYSVSREQWSTSELLWCFAMSLECTSCTHSLLYFSSTFDCLGIVFSGQTAIKIGVNHNDVWHFWTGMVGLAPKWVRLAPNWTNPGIFQISFSLFWLTEIWKNPRNLSILGQFDPLWNQIWPPWLDDVVAD